MSPMFIGGRDRPGAFRAVENEEKEGMSVLQGTWRVPNHSGLWSLSSKASGGHFLRVGVSGWLADGFHLPSLAPRWAGGPGTA